MTVRSAHSKRPLILPGVVLVVFTGLAFVGSTAEGPAEATLPATQSAVQTLASVTDSSRGLREPIAVEPPIRQAEAHFQSGKRLYGVGETEAARREFDLAISALLIGQRSEPEREAIEDKLADLTELIHQYDISGLGAGEQDAEPAFDKPPLEEIPEPTFPIDPKLRNQVAEELKTTVSQLPLELNDEVLRYIDYFTSGRGMKILLNGLRRAGRYRPLINRIFDEEGIPQELIHIAQAESGFSPRAVSRARAVGMWQFILSRGQEYGLIRTKAKDDRLDPEKATRAAARHLRDLYTQFGDWYLAVAAYNCGPLNVQRAVERTGYADVWGLRRRNALPRETSNYVPIVLAMAILAKNPAHYGLPETEADAAVEYSTVELKAATHLDLVADITGLPVAAIRDLNPALLTSVAPAGYALHIPTGSSAACLSALDLIPAERRTAWRLYRMTEGDTLDRVAKRYRTTAKQVAAVNPALGTEAGPGNLLVIPAPRQAVKTYSRTRSAAGKPTARRTTTASKKPAVSARKKNAVKKSSAAGSTSKSR